MTDIKPILSEDDIRTKVVYEWLKGCGINSSDILIEYSIKLKIGRGQTTVNSRSDVLVKTTEGKNLCIVEVKRPSHELNDDDKWQAISYSRSLAHGGIAPFSILTNGSKTKIWDSVSGDLISESGVEVSHSFFQNGFQVSGDAITARAEALEFLITLSEDNLLAFCKGQVAHRLSLLKDEDVNSGKKYIPKLYVERRKAANELDTKLNGIEPKEIVLVVGPPQHGKTNFICASVEKYLAQGNPCLFYPAVALKSGILDEILHDFEWSFRETLSHAQLINRFNKILTNVSKKLLIFVDGWNEMVEHAAILNEECSRLANAKIQIILSTTSPSLNKLLKDGADNPDYIAQKIKLTYSQIKKLTGEALNDTQSSGLIQIGKFDSVELSHAKKLYEDKFNVTFSKDSNLPDDPFYLRLAAEQYSNSTVPEFATRATLIHESLIRKALRRGLSSRELFRGLNQLNTIIFLKDSPLLAIDLPEGIVMDEKFIPWVESGILINIEQDGHIPMIDFYYSHDRDYSLSLNRNWINTFSCFDEQRLLAEITLTIATSAGTSALSWFLSCPENVTHIAAIFKAIDEENQFKPQIQKILADSILMQINFNGFKEFSWLEPYIDKILTFKSDTTFVETLAELLFSFVNSIDKSSEPDRFKFGLRSLLKYDYTIDEIGLNESYINQLYGEEITMSYDGYGGDTSFDLKTFMAFLIDPDIDVAKNAAICIANVAPKLLLKSIPVLAKRYLELDRTDLNQVILRASQLILYDLQDGYYGSMCPGWLTYRKQERENENEMDEEILQEYNEQCRLWIPAIRYGDYPKDFVERVEGMLKDLKKCAGPLDDEHFLELSIENDPNQLKLDF